MKFNSHNHANRTKFTYHQVHSRREDSPDATACTAEANAAMPENTAGRGGEGSGYVGAWNPCPCPGLCLAAATRCGHSNRHVGWEGDRNPCRLCGLFAGAGNAAAGAGEGGRPRQGRAQSKVQAAAEEGERRRKGICRGILEAHSWPPPLEFGKP